MIVITVARKPVEGTVAQNALKHGTGGLNIDGSRVGLASVEDPDKLKARSGGKTGLFQEDNEVLGNGTSGNSGWNCLSGRWPANLILQHLPTCVEVGVKRVSVVGATARTVEHGKGVILNNGGVGKAHDGFRDADGKETVTAWECHPDCPVAHLDGQAGDRPVSGAARAGNPSQARNDRPGVALQRGLHGNGNLPNDEGGASRFFKQTRPDRTPG